MVYFPLNEKKAATPLSCVRYKISSEEMGDIQMKRAFIEQNVYDALQERFKFIFEEFDNIYLFPEGRTAGCY